MTPLMQMNHPEPEEDKSEQQEEEQAYIVCYLDHDSRSRLFDGEERSKPVRAISHLEGYRKFRITHQLSYVLGIYRVRDGQTCPIDIMT